MTALAQTKAIHTLRRQIPHYTDADYRAYLLREFKVDSSIHLTYAQANRVIETLATLAGQNGKLRRASERAEGPYAAKLRALWISAYHLGVARSRDDKALIAFVERQTGLSHTRFLKDPADAAKAIEALKSWLKRATGVAWPQRDSSRGFVDSKRAVANEAMRIAVECGAIRPAPDLAGWGQSLGLPSRFEDYGPQHWDKFTAALGARIRAKQARAKKKEAA